MYQRGRDYVYDHGDFVKVYVDGACPNNGKPNAKAGAGVWFEEGSKLNASAPVKGPQTNINAEIQAATQAVKQARQAGIGKLSFHTDSEFVVKSMTEWLPEWKRNGWKTTANQPVQNKDSLMELDNNVQMLDDVEWKHVDAHSGIRGNEEADKLAKKAAA